MFRWFATLLHARQRPAYSDQMLQQTIEQVRTCRGHLAMLMEEARFARQLLAVTEVELNAERQRVRQFTDAKEMTPATFTKESRQR